MQASLPDKRACLKTFDLRRAFLRRPGLSDYKKACRERTRSEWKACDKLPAPFRDRRRRVRRGCVRELPLTVPAKRACGFCHSPRRAETGSAGGTPQLSTL